MSTTVASVATPPPPPATSSADWMKSARGRVDDFKRLQELGLISLGGDFFPSVHYPPITMYPRMQQEELFKTYTLPGDGLIDVYAHLPFCARRCIFCHYPVKLGEQYEEKERYLAAFEKEMDIYLRVLGLEKFRPRTILVGGGTPSYLTPEQLKRYLEYFCRRMDLSKCRQFNYDVDPNTLCGPEGLERLKIMRDYGVNRLTIGVQSFNNHVLKLMNRHHDSHLALESIRNCQDFGYKVNIEFIFGFMGQTIENWLEVMQQAVETGVEEIQLYRLKVEAYGDHQGVVKQVKKARADAVPTTEEGLMMKQLAIELLRANGYHENLRRVFSKKKPDFSLYAHNQCCELYDQIGLGLTAFSSMRDRFGLNTQSFEEYYELIDAGRLPLNRGYVRTDGTGEEQIRWAIILPLKNREVRKKRFWERTGASINTVFRPKIERLKAHGLAQEDDRFLELTPLGGFFADECCHQFVSNQFMAFPRSTYTNGPLNPYADNEL